MNRAVSLVTGALVGAVLMYVADPAQGARRRASARDRAAHTVRHRASTMRGLVRHLLNRARGTLAAVHTTSGGHVPDEALVARIRSKIGHVVSHPHRVEITASGGHVVLAGHVLEDELVELLKTVAAIDGVVNTEHALTVHQSAQDVLALRPRTPDTNHRGVPLPAAILAGVVAGALLARAPWRGPAPAAGGRPTERNDP